jgi:hypothetical protein
VAIPEVPFRANAGRCDTQSSSVRCKWNVSECVSTDTVQEVGVRRRSSEQAARFDSWHGQETSVLQNVHKSPGHFLPHIQGETAILSPVVRRSWREFGR